MITKVEKFLHNYKLLDTPKTFILGFSGGFDSLCLLNILHKLSVIYQFKLIAAHLNHNWRGEASASDAENCKNICKSLEIEFYSEVADENLKHSETVAREIRYIFFENCIKKFKADAFFTAHNKTDNAETVIYRAIKGTGIRGLEGISEHRANIYRPMLDISRKEIENYCIENNLTPNVDSSNNDNRHFRNLIRNNIFKEFEKINPNVENALCSLANLAREENEIVNEYMKLLKKDLYFDNKILMQKFKVLSIELKKKIIYDILLENNLEYDQTKIISTLNFIENCPKSGKKMSLNNNLWIFANNKEIEIISNSQKNENIVKITTEGSYNFDKFIFTIEKTDERITNYPDDNSSKAYITLNEPISFELRTRRNGDIIQPLGMNGKMKLKKYLISKNIPQHKKDKIIFLCKGSEILWACGLGLNNRIKVVNHATHVLTLKQG